MYGFQVKHSDEIYINKDLFDALDKLGKDKKKLIVGTSCYRSLEKQKLINHSVLIDPLNKGAYQDTDPNSKMFGAVYLKGNCLAGAYGKSNHNYGLAVDCGNNDGDNEWFKSLTNADLKPYGLHKPLDYENWHGELIKTSNYNQSMKEKNLQDCISFWNFYNSMNKICTKFKLDFSYWLNKKDIDKYFADAVKKIASQI